MRGLVQTADSSRKCCEVHKSLRGLRVSRRSSKSELQTVLSNPENQGKKTKPGNPRKRGQHAEQDGEQNPGGQNKRGQQKQASNAGNTQREPQASKGQHNRHLHSRQTKQTDRRHGRQREAPKRCPEPRAGRERLKPRRKNPTPGVGLEAQCHARAACHCTRASCEVPTSRAK